MSGLYIYIYISNLLGGIPNETGTEQCRWNKLNTYRRLSLEEMRRQYGGQDE